MTHNPVAETRALLNLSQEALANKLGMTREHVNRLENGRATLAVDTRLALQALRMAHYCHLRACRRAGRMSERQWQDHVRNDFGLAEWVEQCRLV